MHRYVPGLSVGLLFAVAAPRTAGAQPSLPPPTPAPESTPPPNAAPEVPAPASPAPTTPAAAPAEPGPALDDELPPAAPEPDDEPSPGETEPPATEPEPTTPRPGMVRGRREPQMPTMRAGIGLFHTPLADVGGKYTLRFRLSTEFFRRQKFISETEIGPDTHSRVLGGVALGFTPAKWAEVFFSINNAANHNAREQVGRQDPTSMFALGDLDFGVKAAHGFRNGGVGFGGQLGLGLLSGTSRLLTNKVNFAIDALLTVDLRHLTKKQAPVRFATSVGWMLDNSLKLVENWGAIDDPISREVTRFSLGANHSRMRIRYGMDFPIRFGKERRFGIDPILEWSWDLSTQADDRFRQVGAQDSPLKRSTHYVTAGLRYNAVAGLFLDVAADIGVNSPNFEYGPPAPPWQVMLGLGYSFDPNPEVREVKVAPKSGPAVAEGRIRGHVLDAAGTPIAEARVSFPEHSTNVILTDTAGNFTSFRFPAGQVAIKVESGGKLLWEGTAQIEDGADTPLEIRPAADAQPAVATGIVQGAFSDEAGTPIQVSVHVRGNGVDEPFQSDAAGRIALELFAGGYTAELSAPGHQRKTVEFQVVGNQETALKHSLAREAPAGTPNVSGNKAAIRLKKRIRFDGNGVHAESHALLDELAAFLAGHPEYALVEVGVHTDDRGPAAERSSARASAIVAYLVGKGVAAGRLAAKGHGASQPVAVNLTADGRAKNNRVELRVRKHEAPAGAPP